MPESRIPRGAQFVFTTETVELPNGRRVELDVLRHPGAAAVIPFPGSGRVLLIRQHRHAAGCESIEVAAGKLDPVESRQRVARAVSSKRPSGRARAKPRLCHL